MIRPFTHDFVVRFEDVDPAGIVFFPRFFHYFHVALEELIRLRRGLDWYKNTLTHDRVGLPIVRCECDYRSPLRFGDEAHTAVKLARLGNKSVTLEYEITRLGTDIRQVCAVGRVTSAMVNLDSFTAIPVPEQLRLLFLELDAAEG